VQIYRDIQFLDLLPEDVDLRLVEILSRVFIADVL
jgi:hypothetical protein